MAIVINTYPASTVSVNNEMLFVVYEATKANDPVTYPDYSYVCDVYVAAVMVGRLKARPDPTYKRGVFDVSSILQNFASYGLKITASQTEDYTVKIDYTLKFGEEYNYTLYTNVTVDSERSCFQSYKPRPFTATNVMVNGFVSNSPSTINYHRSQLYHIIPYFSNVSGVSNIDLKYYTDAGTLISTQSVTYSTMLANTIRQANLLYTAPPATASYAVLGSPSGGANDLGGRRINYLCDGLFTPYTLAWLNPFGGYDSQSFGLVSKKNIELARKSFAQLNYSLNASGEVSYVDGLVYKGSKKGFATNVVTKLKLSSHLLNEDEYTWLADLFISPSVYLYDPTVAKFLPVQITESNYDYKNYSNSRLSALEFTVEFSDEYTSQLL